MEIKVDIKRLAKDLPIPEYKSSLAAGVDLFAAVDSEIVIQPGESYLVPTGISIAIPEGYETQIRPRSGLAAKHQISIINSPGTVDADYRGEIKVILINHGKEPFKINRGDRIAQMVLNQVPKMKFSEVEELSETERGEGGFGST
ncbi:MAG: dUTP diphosphatase [Candidatus Aenigmatarchaeota archaeon]